DPQAVAAERNPERNELLVDRQLGEPKGPPAHPDEPLEHGVVELAAAQGQPLEDSAQELAPQSPLASGDLRAELVELPRIDDDSLEPRVTDRVAIAATDLDAPADALGRRKTQQGGIVGYAPGEAPTDPRLFVW